MGAFPRTFEDVSVGDEFALEGRYEVTEEEILEFGRRWDPQPFHTDPEAAADSIFGGLVASGWHTCAMAMRLLADGFLAESGARGAVGVDDLRWYKPVRPGDVLRLSGETVDKEPWSDELGLVHSRVELLDGDDDRVMAYVGLVLWERAGPPA